MITYTYDAANLLQSLSIPNEGALMYNSYQWTASAKITPETALRIGKVVGNGARIWLAMQMEFDLWQAEQAMKDKLAALAA